MSVRFILCCLYVYRFRVEGPGSEGEVEGSDVRVGGSGLMGLVLWLEI